MSINAIDDCSCKCRCRGKKDCVLEVEGKCTGDPKLCHCICNGCPCVE